MQHRHDADGPTNPDGTEQQQESSGASPEEGGAPEATAALSGSDTALVLDASVPASRTSTTSSSPTSTTDPTVLVTQSAATSISELSSAQQVTCPTDPAHVTLFQETLLQRLYFGTDKIRVPAEHLENWERVVRGQLNIDVDEIKKRLICARIRAKKPKTPGSLQRLIHKYDFSLELRMSGRAHPTAQQVTLEPCIWLLCRSDRACEGYRAAVAELQWANLPIEVQNNGPVVSIPVFTSAKGVVDIEKLDLTNGVELAKDVTLYINVEDPIDASSTCGLLCCATIKHDNTYSHQFSRIGGLVSATDQQESAIFGVSTAHGMLNNPWWRERTIDPWLRSLCSFPEGADDCPAGEDSDSDDSGDDDTSVSTAGLDGHPPEQHLGYRDPRLVPRWRNVTDQGRYSFLRGFVSATSEEETAIKICDSSSGGPPSWPRPTDHAVLELRPGRCQNTPRLSNSYQLPRSQTGQSETLHISGVADHGILETGPVTILCGANDAQEGELLPGSVCLNVSGHAFVLRKIRINGRLGTFQVLWKCAVLC